MHKRLSIFLKVLVGMLFILACQKETSLMPNENLLGLHDTIPHDTIPHDTIPHDTIPHDTIPYNPFYEEAVTGLIITPELAENDTTIILHIESKNKYPDLNPLLDLLAHPGDSSLTIYTRSVYKITPSPTANNRATATVDYRPDIDGNHPFSIHMSGRLPLNGSITVTGTQYTFNWNHDSIVTINPKILHR